MTNLVQFPGLGLSFETVSYTHLDVYKRQAVCDNTAMEQKRSEKLQKTRYRREHG